MQVTFESKVKILSKLLRDLSVPFFPNLPTICDEIMISAKKSVFGTQISIAVGTLRVRILHHFPFLLIFSTIGTLALSFLITKSGPLRYFFGLPTSETSVIPGKTVKGLLPAIILAVILIIEVLLGNLL